jgi:hypothetical protein
MNVAELKAAAKEHAAELVKQIKQHESSWDESFRNALALHKWSQWLSAGRDPELVSAVTRLVNVDLGDTIREPLSPEWFDEESAARHEELIASQESCCDKIELSKASFEAANERRKAAQAAIDEGTSRLRFLARELAKPFIHQLPPQPSKQMSLPIDDGEEWRSVPLAEVLADDVALKSVAVEKLGNVTLGQYTELVAKFGMGDKPKKLTRKQWDRVEEAVQEWHAEREGDEGDAAGHDEVRRG